LVEKAKEWSSAGTFKTHIKDFEEAAIANPESAAAYRILGNCYLERSEDQKAEAAYRRTLEISDRDYVSLVNLGHVYRRRKSYDQSAAMFQRAIDVWPRKIEAHLGMAGVHEASGDTRKALDVLAKASEMDPKNGLLVYEIARTYFFSVNDITKSQQYAERAVELDPQCADALYILAEIHRLRKRHDMSLQYFERAYKIKRHGDQLRADFIKELVAAKRFKDAWTVAKGRPL
jgi:tetratricopeptide (TPR) repeat protein